MKMSFQDLVGSVLIAQRSEIDIITVDVSIKKNYRVKLNALDKLKFSRLQEKVQCCILQKIDELFIDCIWSAHKIEVLSKTLMHFDMKY